jgi:hypothetical protein
MASGLFGSTPAQLTVTVLDSDATIYPPPEQLAVADLLPPNLPAAWNKGRGTAHHAIIAVRRSQSGTW